MRSIVIIGLVAQLILLPRAAPAFSKKTVPPAQDRTLILLGRGGEADTILNWRSIVVEEYEISALPTQEEAEPRAAGGLRRVVSPRIAISSIVLRGIVIPIEEIGYILPAEGMYVMRNGQRARGRALERSALDRKHRQIHVERQGMTLVDDAASPVEERPVPRDVCLEVWAAYPTQSVVLGRERPEESLASLTRAAAVVFDPRFLEEARQAVAQSGAPPTPPAPE